MMHEHVIITKIGKLGITIVNNKLQNIRFLPLNTRLCTSKNLVIRKIIYKIKKYFDNPKLQLEIPIKITGTRLQKKIWSYLRKIPCGKTITYGELAQIIGTTPRIIGNACRRNHIPIVIPCHRVVAKSKLGGYCGKTNKNFLKIKQWLLEHESKK